MEIIWRIYTIGRMTFVQGRDCNRTCAQAFDPEMYDLMYCPADHILCLMGYIEDRLARARREERDQQERLA